LILVADDVLDPVFVIIHEQDIGDPDASVFTGVTVVFVGDGSLFVHVDSKGDEGVCLPDHIGLVKCRLFHFLTRGAPFGREIDHEGFVLFFRLCHRLGEVCQPVDFGGRFTPGLCFFLTASKAKDYKNNQESDDKILNLFLIGSQIHFTSNFL